MPPGSPARLLLTIDELLNGLQILETQSRHFNSFLKTKFQIVDTNDPRIIGFAAIQQFAKVAEESLERYLIDWNRSPRGSDDPIWWSEEAGTSRCVSLLKMMFLTSMSTIEYSVRETIKRYPQHPLKAATGRRELILSEFDELSATFNPEDRKKIQRFRRVLAKAPIVDSLQYIIDKSCSLGIVTDSRRDLWKAIVELRNAAAHNNMYAINDIEVESDGFSLRAREGEAIRTDLHVFIHGLVIAQDSLMEWLGGFSQSTRELGNVQ